MVKQKINNSMFKYFLYTIMILVLLSLMFLMTFNKEKPFALAALFVLILLIKDNYKIYQDLIVKDGIRFNGTVIKTDMPNKLFSIEIEFYFLIEIKTDDGKYIKCASKAVSLVPGDRIENAYVTKRSNLLLYYDNDSSYDKNSSIERETPRQSMENTDTFL